MPSGSRYATTLAVLMVIPGAAAAEGNAPSARRTPVVEAVQKARAGVVTVKAERKDDWGLRRETVGSGIVVDERGYVVTNRHIVGGAGGVRVFLEGGKELTARTCAEDEGHDLAILQVSPDPALKALAFGPASDLMVGETVLAVGHPYGYKLTVSRGIVSALDREVTMSNGQVLTGLIQTDASVNPGNSGGPLLNINGEVIGLVVGLREGAQGIGFAINADTLTEVLSRHLSGQKVAGISHGLSCAERVLEEEGPQRERVVVAGVATRTPAAQAGLKPGDEILRVAGRSVSDRFDVERALWDHKPGDRVNLTVVRQGQEISVPLTLGRGTEAETVTASRPARAGSPESRERAAGNETTWGGE